MQLGSVSTLGFIIARYLYEQGLKAVNRGEMLVEDMEIEGSADTTIRCMDLLGQSVKRIGLTLRLRVFLFPYNGNVTIRRKGKVQCEIASSRLRDSDERGTQKPRVHTFFRWFAFLLLAPFFRSSAMTESRAQAKCESSMCSLVFPFLQLGFLRVVIKSRGPGIFPGY